MSLRLLLPALVLGACGPSFAGPLDDLLRGAAEKAVRQAVQPPKPPAAPASAPSPMQPLPPAQGGNAFPVAAPNSKSPDELPARPPQERWPVHDAERNYVAPSATQRVSERPRRVAYDSGGRYGQKFSDNDSAPQLLAVNPYLDPPRFLFAEPRSLQCAADGSIVVGSRAGLDGQAQATATGFWRVAADGAVTPLHTRSASAYGITSRTACEAPFGKAQRGAEPFALEADGSLALAGGRGVARIRADGYVQRVAGPLRMCEDDNVPGLDGFADGPSLAARFRDPGPAVGDGQGGLYVADQKGCALRRVATDGAVSTILGPDKVCPASAAPQDRLLLSHMAWDAQRGELVTGGSMLTPQQLFTTVWRVRPDGSFRRILLGHKVGRSPAGAQLDGVQGLAVDAQGRVVFASRRMENDVPAVLRVDEARGTVVVLTGQQVRPGDSFLGGVMLDGNPERARFMHVKAMCASPDGALYLIDDALVRRIDAQGRVGTWAF